MTDDERPTIPGTFDAPDLAADDSEERITIPALEPAPRLDDTPVARPLRDRGFRTVDPGLHELDRSPVAEVLPPPPQSAVLEAKIEKIEELTLAEEEIDTWRPPPPALVPAELAVAAAVADPSSIAPRELAQRQQPTRHRSALLLPLLAAAALVLLGVSTLLVRTVDRNDSDPRTELSRPALSRGLAASPPPATTPPAEVAAAPTAHEPVQQAVAPIVAPAAPATREVALSAGAQRSTLEPAVRPRVAGTTARAPRPEAVPTELPETPSRKDVAGSLDGLRNAIETCSDGRSGVAEVDLTINGSGAVAHALVSGDFAGTPQGSCMARALRVARFAPFAKPKFRVLYRFML